MAMMALAIGADKPNKRLLKLDQEMKDLAKLLIAEQSLLVFGRGYNYATALEIVQHQICHARTHTSLYCSYKKMSLSLSTKLLSYNHGTLLFQVHEFSSVKCGFL